ncbi:DUF6009 family protein [Streptomyces violascens]|uniref:DUF6009 family protein n=1 Tax=Streptomyces violascens TaxID=67381 RepID=UPI001CFEB532|nr:DUF6009 family protein [Streptomyces violascens]
MGSGPGLRCKARFDIPARTSRRIAAYRSTLDFGGTGAPSPRRALPASHRKHPSGVKQTLDKVNTRRGKPRYERDGRLIGYTNLGPKASRSASNLFARRVFYLLPHDRPNRPDDPECPYNVGSPLEAVDPRTIAPGKTGAKTPPGPRAPQR